jgi:short-subunit dehydrogenase
LLPYTASKFALVGLSEGLHAELAKFNIHVTTVVPNLMRSGSPRNATIKGNHEAEYAWFKLAGSSPLFSDDVLSVAKRIVTAIEYKENEVIVSLSAKLAVLLQGISPGFIPSFMKHVNEVLPDNIVGGEEPKKGYESESQISLGSLGSKSDEAALINNEL